MRGKKRSYVMFYESDDYTTIKTSSEIFSHIFLSPRLIKNFNFSATKHGQLASL